MDGTYVFKYVEYRNGDDVKTTDCLDISSLPIKIQTICDVKNLKITIDDNYYTFSMRKDHLETGYYKLEGEKMYLSSKEDGEYKYTGWLNYRDSKIYYGINQTYIVLDN